MATLYEFMAKGVYRGQMIINRFNFVTDIDDPTVVSAFNLLQALGYDGAAPADPVPGSFFEAYLGCQTGTFQAQILMARNLYSVIDFVTVPVSGAGWLGSLTSGTAAAMPFVAQKLVTNRVRSDIKAGSVAITPPLDTSTDADGKLDTTALNLLQGVADTLNEPPSFTAGPLTVNYRPSVLQKEQYLPDPAKPTRKAYRYYAESADQLEHAALSVTWSPASHVTSQVSRRLNKGR
jgi:hypothetical protein